MQILDSFPRESLGEAILVELWPELAEGSVPHIDERLHSVGLQRLRESLDILARIVSSEEIEVYVQPVPVPLPPVSYLDGHRVLRQFVSPMLHWWLRYPRRSWNRLMPLLYDLGYSLLDRAPCLLLDLPCHLWREIGLEGDARTCCQSFFFDFLHRFLRIHLESLYDSNRIFVV